MKTNAKELPNPWPHDHKGHWWSGWPGALCMRCHREDPMELALADNEYDPIDDKWVSESAKAAYEKASICPADL